MPAICDICGSSEPHGAHTLEEVEAWAAEQAYPVPTSITRQQLIDAIKALGLDPDATSHIELGVKNILVMVHVEGIKYPKGLVRAGIIVPGTMVEIPIVDEPTAVVDSEDE